MESVILIPVILIAVLLVLTLAGGGVALSRRNRRVELEPPAKSGAPITPGDKTSPGVEHVGKDPAGSIDGPASADADTDADVEAAGAEVSGDVDGGLDSGLDSEAEKEQAETEQAEKPSFRERLGRARSVFSGYIGGILARSSIDEETWEDLEEAMLRADVGVGLTGDLLDGLRSRVKDEGLTETSDLLDALKQDMKKRLRVDDRSLRFDEGKTNVWLFVGVNGVGKTTTIGKVARREKDENGRSVLMAAGDTFRAAAAEQLQAWAERSDAEFVRGDEGGDPSSVIFDGIQHAATNGNDLVLADTAGRLHTKSNLMEELGKVRRVADKDPGHVTEVLLVLDATTGQNGLVQAQQFTDAVELTGVVLTKLDGSAKGGIVLAIQSELGIPVKLVGLGEGVGDLVDFDENEFVEALFSE